MSSTINSKRSRSRCAGHSPLRIGGPVVLGLLCCTACFGGGLAIALTGHSERIHRIEGTLIAGQQIVPVKSPAAGMIGQFAVASGDHVRAGQVLARLDAGALDEEITALTARATAARQQLGDVRMAAANALAGQSGATPLAASDVAAMHKLIEALELDTIGLAQRIAAAETRLQLSDIRAPASGVVRSISASLRGGSLKAGDLVLEIAAGSADLNVRSSIGPRQAALLTLKRKVRVVLRDSDGRHLSPIEARVAADTVMSRSNQPGGAGPVILRLEPVQSQIANQLTLYSGFHADVLVVDGKASLFDQTVSAVLPSTIKFWPDGKSLHEVAE